MVVYPHFCPPKTGKWAPMKQNIFVVCRYSPLNLPLEPHFETYNFIATAMAGTTQNFSIATIPNRYKLGRTDKLSVCWIFQNLNYPASNSAFAAVLNFTFSQTQHLKKLGGYQKLPGVASSFKLCPNNLGRMQSTQPIFFVNRRSMRTKIQSIKHIASGLLTTSGNQLQFI